MGRVRRPSSPTAIAPRERRPRRQLHPMPLAGGSAGEIWDINRFPSARQLGPWAGLTPREHSSGEHQHLGQISKQSSRGCAGCWSTRRATCPQGSRPSPVVQQGQAWQAGANTARARGSRPPAPDPVLLRPSR